MTAFVGLNDDYADGWTGEPSEAVATVLRQLDDRTDDVVRPIRRATDEQYAGEATEFVVPGSTPTVETLDVGGVVRPTSAVTLPSGTYLLTVTLEPDGEGRGSTRLLVQFEGPASLRPVAEGTRVLLRGASTVTVGCRTDDESGPARIRVPETVSGVAAGLSYLSVAHETTGPARSHPGRRRHPPLVTVDDTLSVPQSVRDRRAATGIELRVPSSVADLFVAAPLAYYLGADLCVGDRDRAVLTAADTDVRRTFDRLPQFQADVASVLRRVFYLDCLVRRLDPDTAAEGLLDRLDLDPGTVRSLSPAGRLERYLEVPTAPLREELPDWHLSTHVRPSLSRTRCLPYLLDKLSLVYIAEGAEMEPEDLLDRTLTDAFPTRGAESPPESVLAPKLGAGRSQAWMAPGTPIDAFKATPAAFENRFRYRDRETGEMQVTVVRNDDAMGDEHDAVAEIYRGADLPMDVAVCERLTTGELASVLEDENDFVHFIGHCDADGLRCPDGNLATSSLCDVRTRTFFLNACGSYDEGLALVDGGAVAGAVTFTDVLNSHAAMVGTAFAHLLSNGFCLQRAIELARRRIMMGKDYAVVGDGTYALVAQHTQPTVVWLSECDDGFELACEVVTPRSAGGNYRVPFADEQTLNGTDRRFTVDEATLRSGLREASFPVIFDDEFYWSDELADALETRV